MNQHLTQQHLSDRTHPFLKNYSLFWVASPATTIQYTNTHSLTPSSILVVVPGVHLAYTSIQLLKTDYKSQLSDLPSDLPYLH